MPIKEILKDKSDSELVEISLKNRDDFLYIVKKYKDKLYNYIRRITNANHEDAEDILQEVFIKVYRNLNAFDRDLKFSSWIFRITHNQVISDHRKRKARPNDGNVDISDIQIANLADDYDIEKNADANIIKEKVRRTLEKLSDKYREAIVLKFFEEKSYKEMSDILQKPEGTVASLLNKSKSEFKKYFKQIC